MNILKWQEEKVETGDRGPFAVEENWTAVVRAAATLRGDPNQKKFTRFSIES